MVHPELISLWKNVGDLFDPRISVPSTPDLSIPIVDWSRVTNALFKIFLLHPPSQNMVSVITHHFTKKINISHKQIAKKVFFTFQKHLLALS